MIGVSHEKYIENYENVYKRRSSTNTGGDQGHIISPRDATASIDSISENGVVVKENSVEGTKPVQNADKNGDVSAPSFVEAVEGDSVSLSKASEKYGDQAGAMEAVYRMGPAGQDIAKFDNAFRTAYNMGLSGVPLSYALDSASTSYLTETQRENAWIAGRGAADFAARKNDADNKKGKKRSTQKKGTVRGQDVTLEELRAELNDTQNTAFRLLRTFAEATGIDIVLYKSKVNENGEFTDANGKFSLSEDTIYIDINAGLHRVKTDKLSLSQYTMMRTFSHEFVHFCEKWNPVQYNEFRRLVFDRLDEQGVDVDELILIKQEQYGDISYDSASREVMAEAMVDILPDSHFMEELSAKHKNIFTKLVEHLREFLSTLKAHFKSLSKNTDKSVAALREQTKDGIWYFEDIVKAYDKMATEAVENYQAETVEKVSETVDKTEVSEENAAENADSEKKEAVTDEKAAQTAEGEEIGDTFIDPFGDVDLGENPFEPIVMNDGTKKAADDGGEVQEQIRNKAERYSYEWFADKKDMSIAVIDDTIIDGKTASRKQIVEDSVSNAKKVGKTNEDGNAIIHVHDNGADVLVSKRALRHSLDRRLGVVGPVILNIGEILQNAIQINNLNPRENNISESYVLAGMAKNQSNRPYIVSFVVNRHTSELIDMEVLYSVNAKKESAGLSDPSVPAKTADYFTDSSISITDFLDYVNNYYPDILPESVLKHYGYTARPDGVLGEDALYQRRTEALSDREILYRAAEGMNALELSEGETGALEIFKKHLDRLDELQSQRDEQGRIYREQMFTKGGDRAAAVKTRNRMQTLDAQIKRENEKLLSIEDKDVLRRVLSGARKVIEAEGQKKTKEILRRAKDRRDNGADSRKKRGS